MPAIAPITVNDGNLDHVFAPRGADNAGVQTFVESSGVPVADKRLTVSRTRTSQGREKTTIKMVDPIVVTETVNGVSKPSIARTGYADIVLTFESTSTREERAALRTKALSLLGKDVMVDVVDDLEHLF